MELMRSLAVLKLCKSRSLVENAEKIINTSRTFVGDGLTYAAIRHSFFQQFCAGNDTLYTNALFKTCVYQGRGKGEALGRMRALAAHGIGSIFDAIPRTLPPSQELNESFHAAVDVNMKIIEKGIECAAANTKEKFAAVKLATISSFDTLERASLVIRSLYSQNMYPEHKGLVDKFNAYLSTPGQRGTIADLKQEDKSELDNLHRRLASLASIASKKNARLLIDAEESEIQPAIEYVTLSAMEIFNTSRASIFNTYQCYLKESHTQLHRDMESLLSKGCVPGAKLVRGAYLKRETERAAKLKLPSPILGSQSETDASYNKAVKMLLDGMRSGKPIEMMVATHNQHSIEAALEYMTSLKMDGRQAPVYFAQLCGMKDYLTYTLGRHHYKALKLLAFGDVHHVIPYLVRRAQENSSVLGGAQQDIDAIKAALKSRLKMPLQDGHDVNPHHSA